MLLLLIVHMLIVIITETYAATKHANLIITLDPAYHTFLYKQQEIILT